MSHEWVEPISTAEYTAAVRVASVLPFGEELVDLLRLLDQDARDFDALGALRDGGRRARLTAAHGALVRALAASGEVDRGPAPQ